MQSELEKLLLESSKLGNYPVTKDVFMRVLNVLKSDSPKLWDIYASTEEYLPSVLGVVMMLEKNGLIDPKNGHLILTKKGKKFVKKFITKDTPYYPPLEKLKYGIKLPRNLEKIKSVIEKISKEIIPKDEFDQAPITTESAIFKAYHMISRGDITNNSIVCLGDDDLMSLILGMTGLPKNILVIDIDRDITNIIKKSAKKLKIKIPIRTINHDLKTPISQKIKHKFDVFISEPPDTVIGMLLFVSRGVELLKSEPGKVGYVGYTKTGCPPLGILKFWKDITKMNLIICEVLPKFTVYPNIRTEIKEVEVPEFVDYPPSKIWYISDLIRLKTTETTKSLFDEKIVDENLADYERDSKKYRYNQSIHREKMK